jgi:hypothetical protein
MSRILVNYLKSFLIVGVVSALAWFSAYLVVENFPILCSERARSVFFLAASILLIVAGIGRVGWEIQTWGGNSPDELLDLRIFRFLSLLGTFFLIFEYFVGHLVK